MSPELLIESKHIKSNSLSHGDQMIYDIKIPAGSSPFGEWLVKTLAKQDKTIDDLAMALEVTPTTVRKWCKQPERLQIQKIVLIIDQLVKDRILWSTYYNRAIKLITDDIKPNKSINRRSRK